MTVAEQTGPQAKSTSSVTEQPQTSESSFSGNALFLADGKPAFPFMATPESLARVAGFIHNFPLAVAWEMTDTQINNYVLSPHVVFIEVDNALVMLDDIKIGLSAHTGFLFWDRRVSGNEKMLRETYRNVMKMFNLHKLQCNVPSLNRIMYRMLEKIGFQQEGRMREAFRVQDGRLIDIMVYGALESELA